MAEDAQPDPKSENDSHPLKPAQSTPSKLRAAWAWLRAKRWRLPVISGLFLVVLSGAIIASTDLRYPVLGLFIQSTVKITVTDSHTKQPLPKALVEVAGQVKYTNAKGIAEFSQVKPGHSTLKVAKAAYDTYQAAQDIGLFKPTTKSVALKSNGIKLTAQVKNAITQSGVEGVEVTIGDAAAVTDQNGQAELSLPPDLNRTTQDVQFKKDGFNDFKLSALVNVGAKPLVASLAPSGRVFFLSNRSGKIDLYSSNLDGSNPQVVLAGTGNEDASTGILPNVNNPGVLAMVSSREGRRDQYGNVVSDLYLFESLGNKLTKIQDSVGYGNYRAWVKNTLVFEKYPTGACANIMAYNTDTKKSSTLYSSTASGSGCGHIVTALADGILYSIDASLGDQHGIHYMSLAGNDKHISNTPSSGVVHEIRQTLLSQYYTGSPTPPYNTWQSIDLDKLTATNLSQAPSDTGNYAFVDSPGGKYSAFIDERDGKKDLYVLDLAHSGTEKKLTSMGSVNQFVQWYGDDYIVFSSTKSDENALYVVGLAGGQPIKITDFYRGNSRAYGGGYNPVY